MVGGCNHTAMKLHPPTFRCAMIHGWPLLHRAAADWPFHPANDTSTEVPFHPSSLQPPLAHPQFMSGGQRNRIKNRNAAKNPDLMKQQQISGF